MRGIRTGASLLCLTLAFAGSARAQSGGAVKSRATGFFLGGGLEGVSISTEGSSAESGGGAGLVIGYGFNRTFSLLAHASGATMSATGGGTYSLGHFDLATRIHFRAGPNVVAPFIELGLNGRAIDGDVDVNGTVVNLKASGGGVSFGGGLDAHFTPAVAFSGGVVWSTGDFTDYKVNGATVPGNSLHATSARVHLGIIWFAGS